jgi:hypothetical protein
MCASSTLQGHIGFAAGIRTLANHQNVCVHSDRTFSQQSLSFGGDMLPLHHSKLVGVNSRTLESLAQSSTRVYNPPNF